MHIEVDNKATRALGIGLILFALLFQAILAPVNALAADSAPVADIKATGEDKKVADCSGMQARLNLAKDSSGYGSFARELPMILSPKWQSQSGLTGADAVRCAVKITGETVLVINSALSAGIPRDVIKKGLDNPFNYSVLLREPSAVPTDYFNTLNRTRFELLLAGGLGLSEPIIGTTSSGEDVTLSGGGGVGALLTVGRGIREMWDLDFTLGYQMSLLTPEPSGADGGFTRSMALLTMKHRARMDNRSWIKYGFGLGYYLPGDYEVDDPTLPLLIEYKAAPGAHLTLEYETALGDKSNIMTFVFGLKYTYVVYEAESANVIGLDRPLSMLSQELRDLDGSGVDLIIGITAYH